MRHHIYKFTLIFLLFASLVPAQAQFQLGGGVDPSKEKEYLKKAEQGDAESAYKLGFIYGFYRGHQDYPAAVKWLTLAAEKNLPDAEWALGHLYKMGQGVEANEPKAIELLVRSADHGSSMGQLEACTFYNNGLSVPKDTVRAFQYCKKSADQGNVMAMLMVGQMYQDGNGVAMDKVEGQKWIAKSAATGFGPAQQSLAQMKTGPSERIPGMPKGGTFVVEAGQITGTAHDALSQDELNKLMKEAKLAEDPTVAAALYEKAGLTTASPVAWYQLALLYEQGKGVAVDYPKALDLFMKSARQEYPPALFRLGQKYRDAIGVERSNEESYKFFALAAKYGSEEGKLELTGVARYLTPEQVARAQAAADEWAKTYPKLEPKIMR